MSKNFMEKTMSDQCLMICAGGNLVQADSSATVCTIQKRACLMAAVATGLFGALALTSPVARAEAPVLSNVYTNQGDLNTYFTDKNSNLYDFVQSQLPFPDFGIAQTWSQLTGAGNRPKLAEGSGLATFENTLSGNSQAFYLTAAVGGALHVGEIYGTQNKYADLTSETNAHVAESGTSLTGFIDGCAATNNVFYVGGDHHVHSLRWTQAHGWTTSDLTQLSASSVEVSGTALASHEASESEEIFFIGKDAHVHEFSEWSGCSGGPAPAGWHDTDLNEANHNGAPNALQYSPLVELFDDSLGGYPGPNWLDAIIYVDTSHHLRELFISNTIAPTGEWRNVDVTTQSGAPAVVAGSSLASLIWYSPGAPSATESVFFVDGHASVWQVSALPGYDDAVSWSPLNVTAATGGAAQGAVAVIADSPLSADENYLYECAGCDPFWLTQEEIKYVGTDHHVHILGFLPQNQSNKWKGWQAIDMTAGSGAPNATP